MRWISRRWWGAVSYTHLDVYKRQLKHNVGSCYRCRTVIEPRVSQQWFVKMKPLADPAIEAVRSGRTKFVPERFDKVDVYKRQFSNKVSIRILPSAFVSQFQCVQSPE